MTLKTTKPTVDTFIAKAKTEPVEVDDDLIKTDKSFLLRLPIKLWERAKNKAAQEQVSLHDFILLSIKDRLTK
ncbi:MAG: toxin-antitoxin system HicB family antitoxin [Nitrospirae bacterium]|nr:toxin-antitoxin system HicB family antitoxin [Nitrospirota bacterium]MBF0344567.1 toxin-antitoxin system HicB family antitoxin [Nitrospirota bacterium]